MVIKPWTLGFNCNRYFWPHKGIKYIIYFFFFYLFADIFLQ